MGKKEKTNKKGDNEDEKGDQKLQAIVLADSFTKSFRPITWKRPKVLLPLVNVPMLQYTIEFLAQNGVEEVFYVLVYFLIKTYIFFSRYLCFVCGMQIWYKLTLTTLNGQAA